MGFRFSKTIKVAPGVKMRLSTKSVGLSAGGRAGRVSVNSRRGASASVSIPGTGIYYGVGGKGGRKAASSARTSSPPAGQQYVHARPEPPPQPGMFAPRGEKRLFRAWRDRDLAQVEQVSQDHPDYALVSDTLAASMWLERDQARSRTMFSRVFASQQDPASHPFASRYLATAAYTFELAPGVEAVVPFGRDAVGLMLAELHQSTGDYSAAIAVVEQLEPTAHAAVSLAELYSVSGRHEDVIDMTNSLENIDDATALLLVYRGIAFRECGQYDAAREALKAALKSKKRADEVRHLGLAARAETYLAEGKKAMARKDLERILAENAEYPEVRTRLQELA